jgi:hypothetical protein
VIDARAGCFGGRELLRGGARRFYSHYCRIVPPAFSRERKMFGKPQMIAESLPLRFAAISCAMAMASVSYVLKLGLHDRLAR